MIRTYLAVLTALFVGALSFASPGLAHGDHGADTNAPSGPDVPRLVAEGSDFELVGTPEGHKLTIYLDTRADTLPVEGAKIDVMGDGIAPVTAKEVGNGVYEIEADWLDVPGTKALTFTIIAKDTADLLPALFVVPEESGEQHAEDSVLSAFAARPDLWLVGVAIFAVGFFLSFAFRPMRLPPDAAPNNPPESKGAVLKSAASVAVLAALAAILLSHPVSAHEGHDHGPPAAPVQTPGGSPSRLPNGEVFLPKATQRLLALRTAPAAIETTQPATELVGTVIADPSHEGRVQAPMDGQIELATRGVSYVGKSVKAGEVLALLAPAMPVYERGTLAQVTADVEGKLRIAEQKLARLTRISGDYIPQREIDDTREEIASLREQKRVLEPKIGERLELTAPVSGIISLATVRAGQVVSARDTLFEIVDPKRLWIEAIGVAGTDDEGPVADATALDAEGHKIPLSFVGRAPALRQQALPLLFRVDDPHGSLGIGGTVKVLIRHGAEVSGVIVPDGAVVRAPSGLSQVWVKVAPERFAARLVRTVPLDGERVVVTAGLEMGDRVVVQAAELINQVR